MPRLVLSSPAKRSTRVDAVPASLPTKPPAFAPAERSALFLKLSLKTKQRLTVLNPLLVPHGGGPDTIPTLELGLVSCKSVSCESVPCSELVQFQQDLMAIPSEALVAMVRSDLPSELVLFSRDTSDIPEGKPQVLFPLANWIVPSDEPSSSMGEVELALDLQELLAHKREIVSRLKQEQTNRMQLVLQGKRAVLSALRQRAVEMLANGSECVLKQVLAHKQAICIKLNQERTLLTARLAILLAEKQAVRDYLRKRKQ
ncbi:hypothetical protein BASA81_002011 [Batrachochytrium salamandrivorans]|nr:hypothetical protein BASA81_002011 [Batrachochytrium salamandrivorans]